MRASCQRMPGEAWLRRLDPTAKLAATLGFILIVVTTPAMSPLKLTAFLIPVVLSLPFAGESPMQIFKRSLVVIPFVLLIALSAGLSPFLYREAERGGVTIFADIGTRVGSLAMKAWISALAVSVLGAATEFPEMVRGMRGLGMPKDMALTVSFLYRYVFVLGKEARRMKMAYDLRAMGGSRSRLLAGLGYLIGSLFLRTWERAERIWHAMLARGFAGDWPPMARSRKRFWTSAGDWCCAAIFLVVTIGIRVAAQR